MMQQWDKDDVALEGWVYNQCNFRHLAPDENYKSKQEGIVNIKTVAWEKETSLSLLCPAGYTG